MSKRCLITTAIFLLLPSTALAKVTLLNLDNDLGSLWLSGEVLTRYESWNWFEPVTDGNDNNDYDYFFTKSRLGMGYESKWIDAFFQVQHTHLWDLPDNAIAPPHAGALGIGAVYYAHGRSRYYHGTFVKQGYLCFKNILNSGISLKGGRFEYVDALEVTYKNPKVMWLKKVRLAERLVGPFGWSAFTRSFDGGEVSLDKDLFNITAMVSHPTEGGFENDVNHHIDDITLASATLTLKYHEIIPHTEGRIFYFFYDDDRDIAKVDNTPADTDFNEGNIELHTMGFHLLNTFEIGLGTTDGLLWGAWQWGDWGSLSHSAWALDIELGYQFTDFPLKPWFRVGYFISSGDSNPIDSNHETFFQILPTARKYALFPFYNLMNNEDLFIQLILTPMEKLLIRSDLHFLDLNEENDRWYMGAGATKERGTIFGYIGRPSFGKTDLATVIDLMAVYNINKHLSLNGYYGHAWGDDVIENIYRRDDDADFFFFEMVLTF